MTSADLVMAMPHGLDYSIWGEFMLDVGMAIAIELDGQSRTIAPLASQALNFLRGELESTRKLVSGLRS